MADVRVRIRLPPGDSAPRRFEATVDDGNRWTILDIPADLARARAAWFRELATLGAHRMQTYVPAPAFLWADTVVAAIPGSEVLTERISASSTC